MPRDGTWRRASALEVLEHGSLVFIRGRVNVTNVAKHELLHRKGVKSRCATLWALVNPVVGPWHVSHHKILSRPATARTFLAWFTPPSMMLTDPIVGVRRCAGLLQVCQSPAYLISQYCLRGNAGWWHGRWGWNPRLLQWCEPVAHLAQGSGDGLQSRSEVLCWWGLGLRLLMVCGLGVLVVLLLWLGGPNLLLGEWLVVALHMWSAVHSSVHSLWTLLMACCVCPGAYRWAWLYRLLMASDR